MYLLCVGIFYFEKVSVHFLCLFSNVVVSLVLIRLFLNFNINSLPNAWFTNIFSHSISVYLPTTLLTISVAMQKPFNLTRLEYFWISTHYFWCYIGATWLSFFPPGLPLNLRTNFDPIHILSLCFHCYGVPSSSEASSTHPLLLLKSSILQVSALPT